MQTTDVSFPMRLLGLVLLLAVCLSACQAAPAQGAQPRKTVPTPTRTSGSFVPTIVAFPTSAPTVTATAIPTPKMVPTATPTKLEPVGPSGPWKLIFHDEFAGHALDRSKWTTCFFNFRVGAQDCTHDQEELQLYQPQNVTVSGGILSLTARKQQVTVGGKTFHYTSGMISSGPDTDGGRDRFAFTYGYMEMRANVPAGKGYWPGFWTLAADESYPPEIDVFEILGDATTIVHLNYHWPDGSDEGSDEGATWAGPDFSAGWHTYGVDWEPGSLTWYVDGVARFRATGHVTTRPMYLLANLAVGGSWPGHPNAQTSFPGALQIDYVRVWQGRSEER